MSIVNSNKTLVIVPCGKKKIWAINPSVHAVKAKDAYISNYFKLCKLYAERFSDKWVILSGKYGIIEPDFILHNDYNIRLHHSDKFKNKVKEQLKPIISNGFTQIVSLCGNYYSCFLRDVFMYFNLKVETPLQGMKIGYRQKRLKICLESGESL